MTITEEIKMKFGANHLEKGSVRPEFADGEVNVVSMRFCPYAQRTMLMLIKNEIP